MSYVDKAPAIAPHVAREMKLFVGSVDKAFLILECFNSQHHRLTLTELAALTGLDNSSLQRFLHTLVTLGYLRKYVNRQYGLAPKILNLGTNYLRTNELVERATPYLQIAHAKSSETINLIELDGVDTVFVIRFLAEHPVNIWLLGSRTPVYCSAAGRVMLAFLPGEDALEIIEKSEKRAFTKKTLTSTKAIMAEIKQARALGYAVSEEEFMLGDVSVAAPVFNQSGQVIAAVSVAASIERWKSSKVRQKLVSLAVESARLVSRSHQA
jgi:IclR family transcriptional regulator, pca regulon regulatory protein